MTSEEAIKQLNSILEYFEDRIERETDIAFDKEEAKKDAKAIRMGIEAIEQGTREDEMLKEIDHLHKYISKLEIQIVEQEPCDDTISRQAVEEITYENPSYTDSLNVLTEVRDKVRALPSVTPKQETGRWIFVDEAHEHACCSECDYGDVDLMDGKPHNYCECCGIKMQAESEDKNETDCRNP